MARYDDLNTGVIAYATFLSSIALVVIILLIRALCYYWVESEDARKLADAHYTASDEEISEQKAMVDGYLKVMVEVPAPAGAEGEAAEPTTEERIHIPVTRAKEILLEEWNKDAAEPTT